MKKILLLSMIVVGGMVSSSSAEAQKRVNVQININSQPDWGPAGYDYAQYYYLPDANMYYDIAAREYIYQERGRWVNVRVLPPYLRNVDLYRSYKVVINDRTPWMRNDKFRKQYHNNRNRPQQMTWRDSRNYGRREVTRNDRKPDFDNRNDRDGRRY